LTPPPEASAAPVSDRNPRLTDATEPGTLIVPASAIFDAEAVRASIDAACRGAGDAAAIRAATVAVLTEAGQQGRDTIAAAFADMPLAARRTTRAYCHLTDCLVREVLHVAETHLHPNPLPSTSERMAVLGVGGYGRGEMAPFSDVDLLFVTPWKMTAAVEKVIESALYMLWDLRMKVGHASRTVKECLRLGKQDVTIRTSLLEMRFLAGEEAVAAELQTALRQQLFDGSVGEFIEAKLEERSNRHKKQGGQRYMLEPNVKEGKGGLRDLQTLYWIAKYEHGVARVGDLVDRGIFRPEEFASFDAAERFLWAVRCHLHLIAGRAQDQLTFDNQVAVAERMGYQPHSGRRAVEHFMQDYFRHATRVGELTRIFLTELEARHVKQEPGLLGFLRGRARRRKKVRAGYAIKQNRITVEKPDAFFADKVNILRIFEEALRTGYLLHPDAMREIQARIHTIDDAMRRDPEAVGIFLDLLLKHGNPERALRRMNELGVLAAFLPEFGPVVAMMQFNMYHSYTVDEHTIQVISTLAQIEREELIEDFPSRAASSRQASTARSSLSPACCTTSARAGRRTIPSSAPGSHARSAPASG
jgi:[protein-PII] uridylyltransferase